MGLYLWSVEGRGMPGFPNWDADEASERSSYWAATVVWSLVLSIC
jgi:hypothetical protein